ncbi:hypothetical protein POPTR_001G396700v4 [Populus trichocarpa]|uniref:50S ribosomal protein L33, chloroplastic n=1 Tax=Populus trichocarpa TaxID=3694 RepID=A0A3N7EEL9_POPTR|nr:hypothetical protein POPTR_001G396700v4 [Populus trichocarpa]
MVSSPKVPNRAKCIWETFFPKVMGFCQFSGFLSINTIERSIRQSVVCMARRYGANTRKRKIQSRRKGGDREKKKKRRRKAARKNKDSFKIIRLVSAAGTGYVYAKRKGKRSEKLEIKKYDPVVKHHVFFKESK